MTCQIFKLSDTALQKFVIRRRPITKKFVTIFQDTVLLLTWSCTDWISMPGRLIDTTDLQRRFCLLSKDAVNMSLDSTPEFAWYQSRANSTNKSSIKRMKFLSQASW